MSTIIIAETNPARFMSNWGNWESNFSGTSSYMRRMSGPLLIVIIGKAPRLRTATARSSSNRRSATLPKI